MMAIRTSLGFLGMLTLAALLSALPALAQTAPNDPAREDWIQLFNGKDLTGWMPKITGYALNENYGNTFRVENGLLKVSYDQYTEFGERFGHLFYRDPFSYYRIRVEYRFIGPQAPKGPAWARRNSGIMVHCQPPDSMGKNQDFPISIEVQLLGGLGEGPRSTLNLCTPGTNVVMNGVLETKHCIQSTSKTYDGDGWVTAVRGCWRRGNHALAEGQSAPLQPPRGGGNVKNFIQAQEGRNAPARGHSCRAFIRWVRKVELLNLEGCMDPTAKNYKSYFVKADNAQCVR